jgi:hypothetical protein
VKGKVSILGTSDGEVGVREGEWEEQPGDGHCIFSSLLCRTKHRDLMGIGPMKLRELLVQWLIKNYMFEISSVHLWQWVEWGGVGDHDNAVHQTSQPHY